MKTDRKKPEREKEMMSRQLQREVPSGAGKGKRVVCVCAYVQLLSLSSLWMGEKRSASKSNSH